MKTQLALTTLALAAGASAQTNATFILMASNDVTPATPSTTISVYAAWDQPMPPGSIGSFFLGFSDYDLVASDGDFTSASLRFGMSPPNHPGTPNGSRVERAVIGQIVIPGVIVRVDNPVLLAEYEWVTTDFSRRTVELYSENTRSFTVWPFAGGPSLNLVSRGEFTPGAGAITVIPGPSVLAFIALAPAMMRRSRPGEPT